MLTILLLFSAITYLSNVNGYTNPIVPRESADPWVILNGGYYYYMHTMGGTVTVWKSARLENVNGGQRVDLYTVSGGAPIKSDIWAPELWYLNGVWMVYATGNTVGDISKGPQQIFVLKATTPNPLGPYTYEGLPLGPDIPSLDATILDTGAKKYLLWSQWEAEGQCLWIGPLESSLTVVGQPRVRISCPDQPWEKLGGLVNEGPEILIKNNVTHVIYSASFCGTADYCLGMLTNRDGNFLNAASWEKKKDAPVFRRSDTNHVWGVGHCSFTKSPDAIQDWIAYHGMDNPTGGEPDRSTRIQSFTWNSDDSPNFGDPVPAGVPYPDPSGEKFIFTNHKSQIEEYDSIKSRQVAAKTAREWLKTKIIY